MARYLAAESSRSPRKAYSSHSPRVSWSSKNSQTWLFAFLFWLGMLSYWWLKMRGDRSEPHFGQADLRWFVVRRVKYTSRDNESVEEGTCSLIIICFRVHKLNMNSCEGENLSDAEGEKATRQTAILEQATNSKDEHLYDINFFSSVYHTFKSAINQLWSRVYPLFLVSSNSKAWLSFHESIRGNGSQSQYTES